MDKLYTKQYVSARVFLVLTFILNLFGQVGLLEATVDKTVPITLDAALPTIYGIAMQFMTYWACMIYLKANVKEATRHATQVQEANFHNQIEELKNENAALKSQITEYTATNSLSLAKAQVQTNNESWEGFDVDDPTYPEELDIAFQAWRAVSNNPSDSQIKERIAAWLNQSGYKLKAAAIERITTVCNWDKGGGRPKSTK